MATAGTHVPMILITDIFTVSNNVRFTKAANSLRMFMLLIGMWFPWRTPFNHVAVLTLLYICSLLFLSYLFTYLFTSVVVLEALAIDCCC
jgi:uncharacterized metal-binding protein